MKLVENLSHTSAVTYCQAVAGARSRAAPLATLGASPRARNQTSRRVETMLRTEVRRWPMPKFVGCFKMETRDVGRRHSPADTTYIPRQVRRAGPLMDRALLSAKGLADRLLQSGLPEMTTGRVREESHVGWHLLVIGSCQWNQYLTTQTTVSITRMDARLARGTTSGPSHKPLFFAWVQELVRHLKLPSIYSWCVGQRLAFSCRGRRGRNTSGTPFRSCSSARFHIMRT